jgi:hypothetical protein
MVLFPVMDGSFLDEARNRPRQEEVRMQSRIVVTPIPLWLPLHAGVAAAATIVPGATDPNLAGRADGYSCCGGDTAPATSPALVSEPDFSSCDVLNFSATGVVSYQGGPTPGNNPDGDGAFSMANYGDGISPALYIRTNALVGVFLGDDSPTGSPTPDSLSFQSGLGFAWSAPGIGQIFFIGDGLTSDSYAGMFNGDKQSFIVPSGATRLFLGTVDGGGWYNNTGSFSVDVSISSKAFDACGDPAKPAGITASDALLVLRAAVGVSSCLVCTCDVDASGSIVASDALAVLRHAVGQNVALTCQACC